MSKTQTMRNRKALPNRKSFKTHGIYGLNFQNLRLQTLISNAGKNSNFLITILQYSLSLSLLKGIGAAWLCNAKESETPPKTLRYLKTAVFFCAKSIQKRNAQKKSGFSRSFKIIFIIIFANRIFKVYKATFFLSLCFYRF